MLPLWNNMSLPSSLPLDQVEDQIPDWAHNIIIGDWVIEEYDDVSYPGEVTNINREDIFVNVMVTASENTCK